MACILKPRIDAAYHLHHDMATRSVRSRAPFFAIFSQHRFGRD
jgi:hypothetical protein